MRVVRPDTTETRRVRAPGTAGPVRVHSQSLATTSAPAVMRTVRTMCVRSVPRDTRAATATSEYRKHSLNTYQNKYSACHGLRNCNPHANDFILLSKSCCTKLNTLYCSGDAIANISTQISISNYFTITIAFFII